MRPPPSEKATAPPSRHGVGRRIFLMSPLHHHFRKKGWPESKIVTRFYIAGMLCAVVALSTMKIR